MRVLVTGHQGYIGTVMVPLLQGAGHEIVGLDTDLFEGCDFGEGGVQVPSLRMDVRDVQAADLKGVDAVIHLAALSNDPQPTCEPQGWPRIILHNYRTAQIVQTPKQVLVLYQFNRKWRNIWTDGRANPKVDDFLEPRWWGYSVGRWTDDYTFVAETVGLGLVAKGPLELVGQQPRAGEVAALQVLLDRAADGLTLGVAVGHALGPLADEHVVAHLL